jgi:hypothetical protein
MRVRARLTSPGDEVYLDLPVAPTREDEVAILAEGAGDEEVWKNFRTFRTRKAAIAYARRVWGADAEGRVNLIAG